MLSALPARPAGPLLTTPTLHLATAGPTNVTPDTAPADFTEAAFPGYAAFALSAFSGPINLPSADGSGLVEDKIFVCSGTPSPSEVIVGYWVDDTATDFYLGELFATPVSISNAADFLELTIYFFTLFTGQTN
jgi:hypothetical protein